MLCPICKKPVDDAEAAKPKSVYPFCSDRCKLIDLGRWLDGKYTVPINDRREDGVRDSDSEG